MQTLNSFFNHPLIAFTGAIAALWLLATIAATIYLIVRGILPVLYRLGIALSKRKIALFATEKADEISNILVDSGLYRQKNILVIDQDSIKRAANCSLYIVHYKPYSAKMTAILDIKRDTDALIVYSPAEDGKIELEKMKEIGEQRNTVLCNFRGRLINDVLVCMITTGLGQKRK